jgi:hypothetical protein
VEREELDIKSSREHLGLECCAAQSLSGAFVAEATFLSREMDCRPHHGHCGAAFIRHPDRVLIEAGEQRERVDEAYYTSVDGKLMPSKKDQPPPNHDAAVGRLR